jgi:hypothetical protein
MNAFFFFSEAAGKKLRTVVVLYWIQTMSPTPEPIQNKKQKLFEMQILWFVNLDLSPTREKLGLLGGYR